MLFTFIHKTNAALHEDVIASNLESARIKLSERVTNPQDYKYPGEDGQKLQNLIRTSGNPHGADEHATPEHLHVCVG